MLGSGRLATAIFMSGVPIGAAAAADAVVYNEPIVAAEPIDEWVVATTPISG